MNRNDKQYLRALQKMRPGYEVFKEMVRMLANLKTETDQILNTSLVKKPLKRYTSQ